MTGFVTTAVEPAKRALVDELLHQGLSLRVIGRQAGVSHEYVRGRRRALTESGVPLPERPVRVFGMRETSMDEVRRLAAADMTGMDIAAHLAVQSRTIYRLAKKYGIDVKRTRRVRAMSDFDVARLTVLYRDEKRALRDLAAEYGISLKRARRLLTERGVAVRPMGRPRKT